MLSRDEIIKLLQTEDKNEIEALFARARDVKESVFGNKMFAYGFVYFTTYCKNECAFCYFRKSNNIERYRKSPDEVIATARALADSGVNLIDLTMGEDLAYHEEDFNSVIEIVKTIKKEIGVPVMISPGVISDDQIDRFADAGADLYALYQETHNRELFARTRLGQDYDERMHAKLHARDKGMLIEEGIMTGIGENCEDIADSIIQMGVIGASQVRAMSFIPQAGSPMEDRETGDRMLEYKAIALMRIMYPHALIPATLDVDGIAGLEARVNAGASVVTSIIPPHKGYAGVAQSTMDVDEGGRTVEEASHILKEMGLEIATAAEYMEYIEGLKCQK